MATPFGATSTAEEVLRGHDLRGACVLVTGVSAGVGFEIARVLVHSGAEVVGAVRDLPKARAGFEQVGIDVLASGGVTLVQLDLASLANVRACADDLRERGARFTAVICNAGVMAAPQGRTVDGFETQFATNYLGHFVLANRLAGSLEPGGRLVMVSFAGHRGADVDLEDPSFERTPYDPLVAYRRSKTAVVLASVEFDRRHLGRDVRATAVHPGAVLTDTTRELIKAQPSAASAFQWKTVAQGAATPIWAAFVAPAEEVGGRYCEDCHVAEVVDDPRVSYGVRSYALNIDHARHLWRTSEEMVGETF